MASANEAGLIEINVERSGLGEKNLFRDRSDGPVNAGKSPDGVLANLTIDKQLYIPYSGPLMAAGDKITVYFKFDATDGLDVSDGVFRLPYWEDGIYKPLNATDLGITTDLPAATVAGTWVALGAGYTIPSNVRQARFGNGPIVISVEDDTA